MLTIGQYIYIRTGSAVCQSAVATSGSFGLIVDESEKAIKVEAVSEMGQTFSAWFPKKALKIEHYDPKVGNITSMKSWFRPTGWTDKFLDLTVKHGILAV